MVLIRKKRGQQEIAGFILIVVLVVVALLIFLVISAKREPIATKNKNVDNLLNSLLLYTSECVVREPRYQSIGELIKDCYNDRNKKCKNSGQLVCGYLNETVSVILPILLKTESSVNSYEMLAYYEDEETRQEIISVSGGKYNQTNSKIGSGVPVYSGEDEGKIMAEINLFIEN